MGPTQEHADRILDIHHFCLGRDDGRVKFDQQCCTLKLSGICRAYLLFNRHLDFQRKHGISGLNGGAGHSVCGHPDSQCYAFG